MAHQSNPIPEILGLIPLQECVLSLKLADDMRVIVHKCTKKIVTNSYILTLLAHLAINKVILMQEFTWTTATGNLIVIKRNI
jgi:hypothetical protein